MSFYIITKNPNVMMKENHTTQSCEYIIICQDGLYIVSTTSEEILHMLKDKYKINVYLQDNIHMILVEKINIKSRNILKIYMRIVGSCINNDLLIIFLMRK